jgi:Uma2 family endonuclease
MHYQRIPSLQEYVLANHHPRIEIFRRTPGNTWQYLEVSEGSVQLACGPTLDVAALYADLPL